MYFLNLGVKGVKELIRVNRTRLFLGAVADLRITD